jgi:ankyrin repeat protein
MSCNAAAAAAILAGDAAKLAPLISSIDLNGSIPETGQPLLHSAVLAESLSCVGLLLQAGISARLVNGDGESALVPAINRRQYRIAHTLLAAGADMRAADKFGYSLLNNAITARDLPAIVLFLEFGLTIDELHNARFNFPSFDSVCLFFHRLLAFLKFTYF